MFDPAHGAGVTAVVTVVGTLVGTALSVAVVLLPPETRSEVAAPIVAQAANKGLAPPQDVEADAECGCQGIRTR